MRVIVTGASGYLGLHLCQYLNQRGHEVRALVRSPSSRLENSGVSIFTGYEQWAEAFRKDSDCVINLAGQSDVSGDPAHVYEANFGFPQKILRLALAHRVLNWIQAGSYWQYDSRGVAAPINTYATLKQAFMDELQFTSEITPLRVVNLILHDVYGPSDWRKKLLPDLVSAVKEKRAGPYALSSGEQTLSFVHLQDVLEAFNLTMGKFQQLAKPTAIFHLHHEQRTLKAYLESFRQIAGNGIELGWGLKTPAVKPLLKPYFGPKLPGWEPRIGFESGVKGLLDE